MMDEMRQEIMHEYGLHGIKVFFLFPFCVILYFSTAFYI